MEIDKSVYSTLTKNLYRVEFSEAQEQWHLSFYKSDIIDSEDWFTVFDCVNDLEFKIFEIFLESTYSKPYTLENVLECSLIISRFANKLADSYYEIVPIKH
jgi:hypothetical protein